MQLRYYQKEAVDAIFDYWSENKGNPLVNLATGVGKSLTLAELLKRLIVEWPDMRLGTLAHVQELVEGNYLELMNHYPLAPGGVYASSLGRRDARAQILFMQIQTVYDKAKEIGGFDVLGIDECHLIPPNATTMYGKFLSDLLAINPDMKIVGLTATDYRLDSGLLVGRADSIFDKKVYEYGIRDGIDDGYLTPITARPTETKQDVSGVKKSGFELNIKQLQKAVDVDTLNRTIAEEILDTESNRRCGLFFCAGIEHATHFRDVLRSMGKSCETVSGKTSKADRKKLIEAYKAGEFWGMTNDTVMGIGTNVPRIDLIGDLSKTLSASRYVQRIGRETRVIYPTGFKPESTDADGRRAAIASGVKPDARYMDFAGNLLYHGPIDMINPREPGSGEGEAPVKICPTEVDSRGMIGCGEPLHASLKVCWHCGYEFQVEEKTNLQEHASDAPIISTAAAEFRPVSRRSFRYHEGKSGKPDSVKVTYMCGMTAIDEWLCPAHDGFTKDHANRYWRKHNGIEPPPRSPLEWLERQSELSATEEIKIKPKGKYWNITSHTAAPKAPEPVENWNEAIDDEIPF